MSGLSLGTASGTPRAALARKSFEVDQPANAGSWKLCGINYVAVKWARFSKAEASIPSITYARLCDPPLCARVRAGTPQKSKKGIRKASRINELGLEVADHTTP